MELQVEVDEFLRDALAAIHHHARKDKGFSPLLRRSPACYDKKAG